MWAAKRAKKHSVLLTLERQEIGNGIATFYEKLAILHVAQTSILKSEIEQALAFWRYAPIPNLLVGVNALVGCQWRFNLGTAIPRRIASLIVHHNFHRVVDWQTASAAKERRRVGNDVSLLDQDFGSAHRRRCASEQSGDLGQRIGKRTERYDERPCKRYSR
jgi:hypothetical protein